MDYIELGPTPIEEDCAAIGVNPDADRLNRVETRVYKEQLERMFPITQDLHGEVYFRVKAFSHDAGTYREVCIYFNGNNIEAVDFAMTVEGECPLYWDAEALASCPELKSCRPVEEWEKKLADVIIGGEQ